MIFQKNKTQSIKSEGLKKINNFCSSLIVGLGNPGYDNTRHNIGADMLNFLIKKKELYYRKIKNNLFIVNFGNWYSFVYLCPSMMNESGKNIQKIMTQLNCKKLVVVVDDLETKVGHIKKSFGTSSKGHNGIKSIFENLGHKDFWKISIGIGRPKNKEDVPDYVLEYFPPETISLIQNKSDDFFNLLSSVFN